MLVSVTLKDGRPAIIDTRATVHERANGIRKPIETGYILCKIGSGQFQPIKKSKIAPSPKWKRGPIGTLGLKLVAAA